jgi:hypothetical protein
MFMMLVLHRYKMLPSGEVVSGEASVIQSQHYALGVECD